MLSDNELAEIKKRADNATKGPWKAFVEDRVYLNCLMK